MPLPEENILEGERICLTALVEEDLATIGAWYRDSYFLRLYDSAPAYPKSPKQLGDWFKESEDDPNSFIFAIRFQQSHELIGLLEFDGISWTHGTSFLSIGIGARDHRGQGYGKEAMQLALRFAFGELNLRRLSLTVFSYNEAAIALYEQLGFRHEGTFREHLRRDGQWYDMYLYGLLRREWEQQQVEDGRQ
jgi:RimJ/RimL family protein N-acetyltransferase